MSIRNLIKSMAAFAIAASATARQAALAVVLVVGLAAQADAQTIRSVPADYSTIQAAINAAQPGDTVLVADGTYTGTGNTNLAFGGKAITVASQSGPNNCTIDGGGTARGFSFGSSDSSAAIVDGFTITNCYGYQGGGILCTSGSPTITNCAITSCRGGLNGGGIYCSDGSPAIAGCTIAGNLADGGAGGGIYCSNSNPLIAGCTISENRADYNDGGGGIALYSSSPTITDCTIDNNSAAVLGGGILLVDDSSPGMTNCVISQNIAGGGGGIAIYNITGAPTISNCLIVANEAHSTGQNGGGGIYSTGGNPTITNCTISANTVTASGKHGGAMVLGSPAEVTNCILWDNTPDEIYPITTPATITYSDIQAGTGQPWFGTGCIDAGPVFADGDLRLDASSPCIDVGNNAAVPPWLTTDLDGEPRIVNDVVDMGAYEFGAAPDSDGDGLSDPDEAVYGTDPSDPDTDGDGAWDGTEIEMQLASGTDCPDPLDPDSDGDTLWDGNEINSIPTTDPCNADTDGDGVPDNIDPFPTDPGGTAGYVEEELRDSADYIGALDLLLFTGPNNNANRGRRNALSNRANAAANNVGDDDYAGAIDVLENLLRFIDGEEPPPDWISDCDERDYLYDTVNFLAVLLAYM